MTLTAGQAPPAPFSWGQIGGLPVLVARLREADAVFTTRQGGASGPPYQSLNLGDRTGDEPERVTGNRARVLNALGRDPDSVAWARQVHGAGAELHSGPPGRGFTRTGCPLPQADAQITTAAGVTPLVLVADCLPLVISAKGVVAVAHCGWRGLVAGIVVETVERVCRLSGLAADRVEAALGPAIGPCCYEIGGEVVAAFGRRGHEVERTLDLPAVVAAELARGGVEARQVVACGVCTCCNPDLFYSHRRDGERTGRQAGIAWRNC